METSMQRKGAPEPLRLPNNGKQGSFVFILILLSVSFYLMMIFGKYIEVPEMVVNKNK